MHSGRGAAGGRHPPAVTGYRAVRQDVAVADWPVVHAWTENDPDFVGAVVVMAAVGRRAAPVPRLRPRPCRRPSGTTILNEEI